MRVLTVKQPWAWAIVHGGKDVENRVRSLGPYRGPVAIHAGLRIADGSAWTDPNVEAAMFRADSIPAWSTTLGAVIGVVDLVDAHRSYECWHKPWKWETADAYNGDFCSSWAMPDHHHLVLANPRPLPRPIPATGRLGLWRPDDALLAAITEQLRPGEVTR